MYFYKSSINMYLPLTASVLLHGELLNFFSNFDYFLTANGTLIIYYYENLKDLWGFLGFFLKTILIWIFFLVLILVVPKGCRNLDEEYCTLFCVSFGKLVRFWSSITNNSLENTLYISKWVFSPIFIDFKPKIFKFFFRKTTLKNAMLTKYTILNFMILCNKF